MNTMDPVELAPEVSPQIDAEFAQDQARLLDLAHDAIIVRDYGTRQIRFWNKGAERLYGWTADEAVNERLCDLILGGDGRQVDAINRELLAHGEWSGELHQVTKDRARIVVHGRATLTRGDDGQPRSVLIINTDLTEKKKIESQFLRVQRIESIGTLASGIAHDLNNILSPIMMSAPLLRRELSASERDEIVSVIELSARRGAEIVQQVLAFESGVEGEKHPLNIGLLVAELISMMGETFPKNIKVEMTAEPGLWPVIGNATQLHQVLLNLCVNARDAMPAGGRLRLHVANLDLAANASGTIPEARPGPHVVIDVSDDGSGIPRSIFDRIFDPFFTTKSVGKGTGLGLSTTLGIVKNHGGVIAVESAPGRGTTFRVSLPAKPGPAEVPLESTLRELPRGRGELILIIDDEASVRSIVGQTLETFGYRVMSAADGAEGIAKYAEHSDAIALVITDMMMPLMDGASTIRVLMRMNPALKIIAASGSTTDGAEMTEGSSKHFMAKPYTADTLLRNVDKLLRPAA